MGTTFSVKRFINEPQKERLKSFIFPLLSFILAKNKKYLNWSVSHYFLNNALKEKIYISSRKNKNNSYKWNFEDLESGNNVTKNEKLAVHIHVFYTDIFEQILHSITLSKLPITKLFVTCRDEIHDTVHKLLKQNSIQFEIFIVPNLGRDVYPFISILHEIIRNDYTIILKLHTKRSDYLNKSQTWLIDILDKLTHPENIGLIFELFKKYPGIGLVAPEGHVLPLYLYYGENGIRVFDLCQKLSLSKQEMSTLHFVAGTMFYARPTALKPLLDLNLVIEDFEEEKGRLDGTLAHALERMIGASVTKAGMVIADTGSTLDKVQFTVQTSYPFAK